MKPIEWSEATNDELKSIEAVALDIDETLSTRGKLTDEAYSALWSLKEAGLVVVPITGRPAGWCDLIARFWPVDAVVGENGAFTFYMEGGVRRRLDTLAVGESASLKLKLDALAGKIQARFPQARWASDQSYREYDLAIDICEDVQPWPKADTDALLALCMKEGAHAKLSSVHVNAWFGNYDKKLGLERWLKAGAHGLGAGRVAPNLDRWLFIGDSPNDEPMFAWFKSSVGVANLGKYLDQIEYAPRWITKNESGAGFAEMARRLVESRKS